VASSDLSNVTTDDFVAKVSSSGVTGVGSVASGSGTASGNYSFACGTGKATADYSIAGGTGTASGVCSTAFGESTNATGDYSVTMGQNTSAVGKCSAAFGENTIANGDYSFSCGYGSNANGKASFACGYNTNADNFQLVTGRSNVSKSGPTSESDMSGTLFIVGNGSGTSGISFRTDTDGTSYSLNGFVGSGADYAEYFEWLDGNTENEDRRGYFVALDGDKIRKATDKDEYILGVISAVPTIIGDSQSEIWGDMYLKDVFGEKLFETIEVEETKDEDGEVIPAHTEKRWILNPKYDSSLKYENRGNRKEWSAVGLMGKLVVIDDGTCQVNGYCRPNENGIATASETGYRVMKRLDENHVRILLKR
jgi:hypothetical protein